ncbi:MAG: hypothetical protein Q4E67_02005 [Planctomycetia bacterium]|nr:hypothetical protein [Planctomycetia bacterium]
MQKWILAWLWMSWMVPAYAQVWDLQEAKLEISPQGCVKLTYPDAEYTSPCAFSYTTEKGGVIPVKNVVRDGENVRVTFADDSTARFQVTTTRGVALFRLEEFQPQEAAVSLQLFQLGIPAEAEYVRTINNAIHEGRKFGLMTASLNVRPQLQSARGMRNDRENCSHTFTREAYPAYGQGVPTGGKAYAKFTAQSKRPTADGWSVRGKAFDKTLDLTGCQAIRAWVHGDQKGEALKIQLYDGQGGHRDDYITIDFLGYRQVTLNRPALNDLRYDDVRGMRFYYNGLPANETVECHIDQVEAVFQNADGSERTVLLADFESEKDAYWDVPVRTLEVRSYARHGMAPAAFGVIASSEKEWKTAVQTFQKMADLPNPWPGGGWRNDSPWLKESYFFLTNFREEQYQEALKIAKRGGFRQILLLQHSWCQTPGHYEVNTRNFKDGVAGLRAMIERFNREGIRFGLHLLAASIDPPDSYLSPVPDERLVLGVETTLAEDITAEATTIPTTTPASEFPIHEHPYMGQGQVIRIGDELIYYGENQDGFSQCRRGYLGTKAVAHAQGTPIRHVVRAYGYFMYDLDSTLREEVAANLARLVNQLPIDMLYFDGSELLQRRSDGRDHWYYNAKLHRAFYDAIENKNIQYQASSFSPYSWYLLTRSASADGHDDLKAYLDERSPAFTYFRQSEMPLDIGWYYGYDARATPDMYEYVLGATIGYNSSMSFQVSVDAAAKHPFTMEILDLIRKYEDLRLSGRVPTEVREKFRIDPILGGKKTVEARNALLDKRIEFRLVERNGRQWFQRMIYPLWQEVAPEEQGTWEWELEIHEKPATVGFQVQFLADAKNTGEWKSPRLEIAGESLTLPMVLTQGQYGFALPGEKISQYGLPLKEGAYQEKRLEGIRLQPGKYRVRLLWEGDLPGKVRVRTPLQLEERYEIPRDLPDFTLRDYHIHIRGGMTAEKAIEREKRTGIRSAVLENSGREWPLHSNETLQAFITQQKRITKEAGVELPVGMQVNDRDWFTFFDPNVLKQLDFVLADTMIMADPVTKKPIRLWMTESYTIDDEEAWMERYMKHNLQILDEPITILANVTYLPSQLADRYHEFWTPQRMKQIIAKAVEKGIALEIQAGSRFPDATFIRMAKEMGVKFSVGTNNFDDEELPIDRWGKMIRECGLEETDFIK